MHPYEPDGFENDFENGFDDPDQGFGEPADRGAAAKPNVSSPIGRLMDDAFEDEQPSSYVTGFERNPRRGGGDGQPGGDLMLETPEAARSVPRRRPEQRPEMRPDMRSDMRSDMPMQDGEMPRRRRPEARPDPSQDQGWDQPQDGFGDPRQDRRPRHDQRPESRVEPTIDIAQPPDDEDYFAKGMRDAQSGAPAGSRDERPSPRERDRGERRGRPPAQRPPGPRGQGNPRRGAQSQPQRDPDLEQDPQLTDEEMDGFRQRYNPDELISTTRGPKRPQRQDVDLSASRGFQSSRPQRGGYDEDANDSLSLIRWVATIGVVVVLLILVFLAVSRSRANARYLEASERIEEMQATYDLASNYRALANSRATEITRLENLVEALQNQPAPGQTEDPGQAYPGTYSPPAEGGEAATAAGFPTTHTVVAGDNLTRIAIQHYGSGSSSQNQIRAEHIATYNNIPLNQMGGIQTGQVLTIPAPPAD